jgi:FtsZ-binding cell division protein ZapB
MEELGVDYELEKLAANVQHLIGCIDQTVRKIEELQEKLCSLQEEYDVAYYTMHKYVDGQYGID